MWIELFRYSNRISLVRTREVLRSRGLEKINARVERDRCFFVTELRLLLSGGAKPVLYEMMFDTAPKTLWWQTAKCVVTDSQIIPIFLCLVSFD